MKNVQFSNIALNYDKTIAEFKLSWAVQLSVLLQLC